VKGLKQIPQARQLPFPTTIAMKVYKSHRLAEHFPEQTARLHQEARSQPDDLYR
jgi:hypothetical protein